MSAMRLRTLPLAASCVLVGSALGWNTSAQPILILLLALFTSWLLQILSNLANDYGDHTHGADNENRVGPTRALQSGVISKSEMFRAIIICASLTFVSGIALLWFAMGKAGLFAEALVLLAIGVASITAAIKYTSGKNPYGYRGFGDLFVFFFFGIVGVCGSAFLHDTHFDWRWLLPASSIGLFATAVLNLNNLRDHVNDRASGKKTLVVIMGFNRAKWYHLFLISTGWFCIAVLFSLQAETKFIGWIFIPLTVMLLNIRNVFRCTQPVALDPELKKIALSTFLFALLFFLSVGLRIF